MKTEKTKLTKKSLRELLLYPPIPQTPAPEPEPYEEFYATVADSEEEEFGTKYKNKPVETNKDNNG